MSTMSLAAYAKEIGVSVQAVYKAIDEGKLRTSLETGPNGYMRVDFVKAEAEWQRPRKPGLAPEQDPAFAAGGEDEEVEDIQLPDGVPHLNASKATREHWMAQTAQLDYEKARGRLLDRNDVRRRVFALSRKTRDAMIAIPERTAAVLASMTNEREVLDYLRKEIESVCEDLARNVEAPALVAKTHDPGLDEI